MAKFYVSAQLNSAKEVMDDSCTHGLRDPSFILGNLLFEILYIGLTDIIYCYYLDRTITRRMVGNIRRVELPDVLDVEGNQTCPKLVTDDTQACSGGVRC